MGLRSWMGRRIAGLLMAAANDRPAGRLPAGGLYVDGQPRYPFGPTYLELARNGYEKNVLVYAGIRAKAEAVAAAPCRLYDAEGHPLPEHSTRALLRRPNPFLTEAELWRLTSTHLDLAGNAFWHKVRSRAGLVVELWPLRPDRVEIVASKKDFIAGYLYCVDGVKYPLEVKDVIHFQETKTTDDYFAPSPLKAALREIAVDNEATDFAKVTFQNGAVPPVAIEMGEEWVGDDDTIRRLTEKWKQRFGGDNRGNPGFLTPGMKIHTIGLDMNQLAFTEIRGGTESRILMALRVPPSIVAAKVGLDASTYANYETARLVFHEDEVEPRQKACAARIDCDEDLGDGPESGAEVRFDLSRVAAYAPRRKAVREAARADYQAGLITKNESRAEIGLGEVEGGDEFRKEPAANPLLLSLGGRGETKASRRRARGKAAAGASDVVQLKPALGRIDFAETYLGRLENAAKKVFRGQARDVLKRLEAAGGKAARKDAPAAEVVLDVAKVVQDLLEMRATWKDQAGAAFEPLLGKVLSGAAKLAAEELGKEDAADFDLPNEKVVAFVHEYSFRFAEKVTDTSVKDVREILERAQSEELTVREIRKELQETFTGWSRERAEMVARTETIRAANHGALFTYRESGVERMEWLASDDACAICLTLNGSVVSVDEPFLGLGESIPVVDEDGTESFFTPTYEKVEVPPAHPHCRCGTVPVVE